MNFRTMRQNDVASFADNLVDLLSGPELASIDPAVRSELIETIGTLPALLRTQADTAEVLEGQRRSMVSARRETQARLNVAIAKVRDELKASVAPRQEFDLCNFDYPFNAPSRCMADDPTELSVVGFANGVNAGSFSGNNRYGQVVYDIWRRQGTDGAWTPHTLTKKQTFKDTGVTPGQYYEYRVRAIASTTVSNFSNAAIVYGVM